MPLHASEQRRPLRSRVHKARRILRELCRLRVKVGLAYEIEKCENWSTWCRLVAADLDKHIRAGEAIGGGFADPRDSRRVRKGRLF